MPFKGSPTIHAFFAGVLSLLLILTARTVEVDESFKTVRGPRRAAPPPGARNFISVGGRYGYTQWDAPGPTNGHIFMRLMGRRWPFWPLGFSITVFAAAWIAYTIDWHAVARRLKRRKPNQCPACGYDVRATREPDGPLLPRCPECGHSMPDPTRNRNQFYPLPPPALKS